VLRGVALAYHAQNDLGISEALLETRLAQKLKATKGNDKCLEELREDFAELTALAPLLQKFATE
jgi:hypothetical protein